MVGDFKIRKKNREKQTAEARDTDFAANISTACSAATGNEFFRGLKDLKNSKKVALERETDNSIALVYETSSEQDTVRSLSAGSIPAIGNRIFINSIQSVSKVRMASKKSVWD